MKAKNTKLIPCKFMQKAQEPFMQVPKGYGYYGVLMETEDRNYVQCHECGELFVSLPSHIRHTHKLTAREYKEKYELNYGTALQSSFTSEKQSIGGEFMYKLNKGIKLSNKEIKKYALKKRNELRRLSKRDKSRFRHTVEMMNKFGTCPDQIQERFTKLVDKYGGAPSYTDMIKEDWALLSSLSKRYNGYTNALVYFGLRGKAMRGHQNWNKKMIELALKKFVDEKRRLPNPRDTKVGPLPDYMTIRKYFKDWWKAKRYSFEYLTKIDPMSANAYDDKNLRRISLNFRIT